MTILRDGLAERGRSQTANGATSDLADLNDQAETALKALRIAQGRNIKGERAATRKAHVLAVAKRAAAERAGRAA
jgi:hypothetical protein